MRFLAANGAWVNNNDVAHALRELPLWQYRLHQHADRRLRFEYAAAGGMDAGIALESLSVRSADHLEGIAALKEKRPPKFGGN